ncbi:hypothetical protein K32_30090 [Kaistia sp. 32K]|uniref:DUF2065 domain-containing protein n=1 Tax=Kaistia sp. 32K TaxID=2795690 RepID=UPI001916A6A9|nr:DUF2065 domain-containing protein [Kaistia sp. 32K]BCP54392.1 hypothetical protein K32_30090 [Kaistia sp. 32K]
MTDFVTALGLVLVIEGVFYAVAPTVAKTLMRQGIAASDSMLRGCGLIVLAIGVAVVWLARS